MQRAERGVHVRIRLPDYVPESRTTMSHHQHPMQRRLLLQRGIREERSGRLYPDKRLQTLARPIHTSETVRVIFRSFPPSLHSGYDARGHVDRSRFNLYGRLHPGNRGSPSRRVCTVIAGRYHLIETLYR